MKYILVVLFFVISISAQDKREMVVKDAWVRPSAVGMNSALFFKVTNNTNSVDTLFDASSDAADIVEVHETYMRGDKMGMRRAVAVVNPGETIEFKPKSLHVMMIKLLKDLKIGEKIQATLHFKKAGDVEIEAEVKDLMPGNMKKMMKH